MMCKSGCSLLNRRSILLVYFLILFSSSLIQFSESSASSKSKYSNVVNNNEDDPLVSLEDEKKPFRMQKVNLLWTKARNRLSGPKLAELYADLKVQDKEEALLKKMKATNRDEDGKKEAQILASYRRIYQHYDLGDHFEQRHVNLDNEIPQGDDRDSRPHFQDTKLQSMWERALQAGFSESDLKMLKEEFSHQQMKIDEFKLLHMETLDGTGDKYEQDDNSVDVDETKVKLSPKQADERKLALKQHNLNIREGYMKLEQMANSLPNSEPVFSDSRVHKLWALAKKTNWSKDELIGFQEELKHFDHRLHKQAYYQEQYEQTAQEGEVHPKKLTDLKEKTEFISQRVKKLHGHLKRRIDKAMQHSEL